MSPSFVSTWLLATVAAAALLGTSLASAGPLEAAERQEQLGRSRQSIERAVETFIDYTTREAFENAHEAPARTTAEMPLPRVSTARLVPAALKDRLRPAIAAE